MTKLLVALVVGLTLSLPAAATMYKWVDGNGITHYGETIPPEYADRDHQVLNKDGRVIKSEEVMTPERRHARDLEDAKLHEQADAELEQQRRDRTLLNTYSNVSEIDLARDRNLQPLDARINTFKTYIKTANDNLLDLQTEADRFASRNRKVPASLQQDLLDAQGRLAKLQQDASVPIAEKAAVEARFAADRARYIQLTGKN